MAAILIWGHVGDLLAGGIPPKISLIEVETLAGLQAELRGSATLVLAEPARVEAERDATESWLRGGGAAHVVLVLVAEPGEADGALRRLPFVDEVALKPVTPERLRRKLDKAIEAVHSRSVIRRLERALSRKGDALRELPEEWVPEILTR